MRATPAVLVWSLFSLSMANAAPGQSGAPLAPDRQVSAARLQSGDTIQVDGSLDERAWAQAQIADGFLQQDPDNGQPATERTEVRLVYDANRLIVGVRLHDTEPGRLLANQMQRDQSFGADDRFMMTIDTYLDGRSGYYFEINPAGAMGDGLVTPTGVNQSWDGIWTARVRRDAAGWSAEIEIPFRTMNFDENAEAWGINFQRTVRRKNEESLWSGHLRNQGVTRMANAGRMVGLQGLSQGLGLDLQPFIVSSALAAPGRGLPSRTDHDIGLDAFYNLTPALRANLSLNTDFAETEVDDRRVNLTRFPLFFEEKRDFFLEGSNFFDFGRDQGEAIMPFFSRRIGIAGGLPQRIDYGAKLTGQAGAFDVGVLQVRTGDTDAFVGEDFSVVRVRRRALQESFVGVLYTRRAARADNATALQTAGVDFALRTSAFRGSQTAEWSGYYVGTTNPAGTGESAAFGSRFIFPNDPFRAELTFREIQPNYSPAVGFLERRGYRSLNPEVGYTVHLDDHPFARSLDFEADIEFINDTRGRPLTRELQFQFLGLRFNDGDELEVQVTPLYERLDEDFEISDGIVLPAGNIYEFTRYQIEGSTAEHRIVSVGSGVEFGDFYSGRRREQTVSVGVRPRRGVAVVLEAEHNVLDLAEGSFSTNVFRMRASTQFSPWISLVNNLQFDDVSQQLGYQTRLRWIFTPGSDLFVVYTHNWQEDLDRPGGAFSTLDRRLATKLVYTKRF